jgi:hypothetical protein
MRPSINSPIDPHALEVVPILARKLQVFDVRRVHDHAGANRDDWQKGSICHDQPMGLSVKRFSLFV